MEEMNTELLIIKPLNNKTGTLPETKRDQT